MVLLVPQLSRSAMVVPWVPAAIAHCIHSWPPFCWMLWYCGRSMFHVGPPVPQLQFISVFMARRSAPGSKTNQ